MKSIQQYTLKCLHCKFQNNLQLKTVIDLKETPHVKDMIMNNEFNKFVCENCLYTCELYYNFIFMNKSLRYVILFSKNKYQLEKWIEKFILEQFEKRYDENLNFLKRPSGVSDWSVLKDRIRQIENVNVEMEKRIFDSLIKKDLLEFYEYLSKKEHLTYHSELSFEIDKLFNKYNITEKWLEKFYDELKDFKKIDDSKVGLLNYFKFLGKYRNLNDKIDLTIQKREKKQNVSKNEIIIDNMKDELNIVLIRKEIMGNIDLKKRNSIREMFTIYQGRYKNGYVLFCAIDKKDDYSTIENLSDFFVISLKKNVYCFFENIFRGFDGNNKCNNDKSVYYDTIAINDLMNELDIYEIGLGYIESFEKFYSICKKSHGESQAVMIAEEYSDYWEELREGLTNVCGQIYFFLSLCQKCDKTILIMYN